TEKVALSEPDMPADIIVHAKSETAGGEVTAATAQRFAAKRSVAVNADSGVGQRRGADIDSVDAESAGRHAGIEQCDRNGVRLFARRARHTEQPHLAAGRRTHPLRR